MERVIVRESLSDSDANYVELYRRLGERDVTDLASLLAGSGSSQVLELGCAAGGTAIPLARRGLEVWAVDADASMLAMVAAAGLPNLRAVEARIEELELGPRFDLVLASSHLVNVVDDAARAAYFRAAARHLAPRGLAVFEVVRASWFVPGAFLEGDDVRLECHRVDATEGTWSGVVVYRFPDVEFEERLENKLLRPEAIDRHLLAAGLVRDREPILNSPVDMTVVAARSDAPHVTE